MRNTQYTLVFASPSLKPCRPGSVIQWWRIVNTRQSGRPAASDRRGTTMARLCLACQATAPNHVEYCPACGRNFLETQRAWAGDLAAWRRFLEQTGWYPGRRDEWAELRWQGP